MIIKIVGFKYILYALLNNICVRHIPGYTGNGVSIRTLVKQVIQKVLTDVF